MIDINLFDIRDVTVACGGVIGHSMDPHWFFRCDQIAYQMGQLGDTDHLVGSYVVGFSIMALPKKGP